MKTLTALALMPLVSGAAFGQESYPESGWYRITCDDGFSRTQTLSEIAEGVPPPTSTPLVTIEFGMTKGVIQDAGLIKVRPSQAVQIIFVEMQGLDLRVNWGTEEGSDNYRYALLIGPKGSRYFDFANADENGTAKPSATLRCKDPIAIVLAEKPQ